MKKPGLSGPRLEASFIDRMRQCLEAVMGRTGTKTKVLDMQTSAEISGAPSAADHNKLVADVRDIRIKLNQLINQVQD